MSFDTSKEEWRLGLADIPDQKSSRGKSQERKISKRSE